MRKILLLSFFTFFFISSLNAQVPPGQNQGSPTETRVGFLLTGRGVSENTASTIIDVVLNAASSRSVSVSYRLSGTATNGTDYNLTAGTVTIPAGSTRGSITLAHVDDVLDEPNETVILELYNPINASLDTRTQYTHIVEDDDPPAAIFVNESEGSTIVGEDGKMDTYDIVLSMQPTSDVTITFSCPTGIALEVENIVFTPDDWNSPQTIIVNAEDDALFQGDRTVTITHSVTTDDPIFSSVLARSVDVLIQDNDQEGLLIEETNDSTVIIEGVNPDTYTVSLTSQPESDVVMTLSYNENDLVLSENTLIFTPESWNTAQTITVTSVERPFSGGTRLTGIHHNTSSVDTHYNDLSQDVVVILIDLFDQDTPVIDDPLDTGDSTPVLDAPDLDSPTMPDDSWVPDTGEDSSGITDESEVPDTSSETTTVETTSTPEESTTTAQETTVETPTETTETTPEETATTGETTSTPEKSTSTTQETTTEETASVPEETSTATEQTTTPETSTQTSESTFTPEEATVDPVPETTTGEANSAPEENSTATEETTTEEIMIATAVETEIGDTEAVEETSPTEPEATELTTESVTTPPVAENTAATETEEEDSEKADTPTANLPPAVSTGNSAASDADSIPSPSLSLIGNGCALNPAAPIEETSLGIILFGLASLMTVRFVLKKTRNEI